LKRQAARRLVSTIKENSMNGSSHLTANRHTFPTLLIAGLFVLFSGFAVAEAPQQKTQVPGY